MIPHQDAFNWIIAPAGNCVEYIQRETVDAAVINRAVINLEGMRHFIDAVRLQFIANGKPVEGLDALLAEQDLHEHKAREIVRSDFANINAHALVGLWSAIEVAVEDTVVLILMKDAKSQQELRNSGFKFKKHFTGSTLEEGPARSLAGAIFKQARNARGLSESYVFVLQSLGLNVHVDESTCRRMNETSYIRNCILHRGGIVDQKVHQLAPGLAEHENQEFLITRSRFQNYHEALRTFSEELLRAATKSRYIRIK